MDILAHMLWANAGGKGLNKVLEKKEKPEWKLNLAWTTFFGVFPDLFAFSIPFTVGILNWMLVGGNFFEIRHHGSFDIAPTLYQYSHSLVVWVTVFILAWLYYKRPRFELLGWALHILIDIPSHTIGFYATPFLFPISDYRFPYGVSWGNIWYMIINYSALLVVYLGFLFRKKREKASPNELV
jgi:hypothetical protein